MSAQERGSLGPDTLRLHQKPWTLHHCPRRLTVNDFWDIAHIFKISHNLYSAHSDHVIETKTNDFINTTHFKVSFMKKHRKHVEGVEHPLNCFNFLTVKSPPTYRRSKARPTSNLNCSKTCFYQTNLLFLGGFDIRLTLYPNEAMHKLQYYCSIFVETHRSDSNTRADAHTSINAALPEAPVLVKPQSAGSTIHHRTTPDRQQSTPSRIPQSHICIWPPS